MNTAISMSDLEKLKNFGPYMVKIMQLIDIHSKEDLLDADLVSIQEKLIQKGIKPHLSIFYSIEMGLQNRNWLDISPTEKRAIQEILKR